MKRTRRWAGILSALCLTVFAVPGGTMEVLAAAKTISKVTINVNIELEPGDRLPDLDISKGSGANVYTDNSKYELQEAEWTSSKNKDVKVGGTYNMKVTLYANEPDEYAFKGSYKASNVTVKGGEFVSASRKNNERLIVTIKTKPLKGDYEAPDEAEWKEHQRGIATWDKVSGVDAYDVTLYRGSSAVYKVKAYRGTRIDFYPYMTKAGTYSFKVRSVPENSKEQDYAKSSGWTESDEIYIAAEDVSNGSGQIDYNNTNNVANNNTGQVGWIQDGSRWWYRYPDGSVQKDSWLYLNNTFYLFDQDGWMLTGWQQRDGHWYFLDDSGAMRTGWLQAADGWYYLNPGPEGAIGVMYENQLLAYNNRLYYLGENGRMAEGWRQVNGNWYYFYPGEGSMAANTFIDTFYVGADGVWRK